LRALIDEAIPLAQAIRAPIGESHQRFIAKENVVAVARACG